ncbi:MAG: helix-turn-helix transcriptional regulator [Clostridia bacterium]|nr:helix-turn-helix transcriptional regulator [Clostridia bacterium]
MDISRIGSNIRYFRKLYGIRQKDLADKLHVTRTVITNYEKGYNLPDIATLKLIADYFRIPVEQLMLSTDYMKESQKLRFEIKADNIVNLSKYIVFRFVYSENALKYNLFYEALEKHLLTLEMKSDMEWEEVYNLYLESWENNHTIEALVNMIGILLRIASYNSWNNDYTKLKNTIEKWGYIDHKTLKYYLKDADSDENNNEQVKFYKENEKSFFAIIKVLKDTNEWKDIADYYLALRYAVKFTDNEYGEGLNYFLFNEYMRNLIYLGNEYAIELLNQMEKIGNVRKSDI